MPVEAPSAQAAILNLSARSVDKATLPHYIVTSSVLKTRKGGVMSTVLDLQKLPFANVADEVNVLSTGSGKTDEPLGSWCSNANTGC